MSGLSDVERFRDLLRTTSVETIAALTADEFEHFVAEVFRRSGYEVTRPAFGVGSGRRLHLRAPGQKLTGVVVIFDGSTASKVDGHAIRQVRRRGREDSGVPVYAVTTGSYDDSARKAAQGYERTYLLGGDQFCRYVRYIHGSRYPESTGITVVIPPELFAGRGLADQQTRERPKVLVIANNKGGVAKTTTARHLGLNLVGKGLSVLLVDLDPQGNLTEPLLARAFLDSTGAAPPHIADYFAGTTYLQQLVRPASVEELTVSRLYLVPAIPI